MGQEVHAENIAAATIPGADPSRESSSDIMRQVILIGDSIRMGYQPVVARLLEGWATVTGPTANGFTTANVLANLDHWTEHDPAAGVIVHINAGLHDIKRRRPDQAIETPLDVYRENVRTILARLEASIRGATLIWARITPVHDQNHHQNKSFDRRTTDVDAFNAVADAVAADANVPINDLHDVIMRSGKDRLLNKDGVHYSAEGYELLGNAVAAKVREVAER